MDIIKVANLPPQKPPQRNQTPPTSVKKQSDTNPPYRGEKGRKKKEKKNRHHPFIPPYLPDRSMTSSLVLGSPDNKLPDANCFSSPKSSMGPFALEPSMTPRPTGAWPCE